MISSVVPAYSEEALLPGTLESLHAAARETGEAYEVIVVDDASLKETMGGEVMPAGLIQPNFFLMVVERAP